MMKVIIFTTASLSLLIAIIIGVKYWQLRSGPNALDDPTSTVQVIDLPTGHSRYEKLCNSIGKIEGVATGTQVIFVEGISDILRLEQEIEEIEMEIENINKTLPKDRWFIPDTPRPHPSHDYSA